MHAIALSVLAAAVASCAVTSKYYNPVSEDSVSTETPMTPRTRAEYKVRLELVRAANRCRRALNILHEDEESYVEVQA